MKNQLLIYRMGQNLHLVTRAEMGRWGDEPLPPPPDPDPIPPPDPDPIPPPDPDPIPPPDPDPIPPPDPDPLPPVPDDVDVLGPLILTTAEKADSQHGRYWWHMDELYLYTMGIDPDDTKPLRDLIRAKQSAWRAGIIISIPRESKYWPACEALCLRSGGAILT